MTNTEQDEFELEVDDGVDLYDDMITASTGHDPEAGMDESPSPSGVINSIGGSGASMNNGKQSDSHRDRSAPRDSIVPLRKFQAYIGNLTWWTSDQDIQDAVTDSGVNDFIEVKFYENRANGQSKGYTVITVGSENSLKLVHDKLPKKELHGQFPVVTPPTKQALNQFEAQAKTRPSGASSEKGAPNGEMNTNMGSGISGNSPPLGIGQRGMMGPGPRGPRMGTPPGMGVPGHRNMSPNMGPGGYGPPRPMMPQNMGPMPGPPRPMPMPMMNEPFYPHGPPHNIGPRGPGPGGMPPRDGWPRSPMNFSPHGPNGPHHGPHGPGLGPHMNSPNSAPMPGHMRGPMPHPMQGTPPQQPPAPHMNPAFFHPPGGPNTGSPMPGPAGPMGPSHGPYNSPAPVPYPAPLLDLRDSPVAPPIPEVEFEEIMSRNRTVSSSAISRAVSDAATGEYASAIETLVTAISLISQSKVAYDDRCKILVSSLRDTLHGIEAKSYGGRSRERSRSRDRDRHRSRRHERSRSREYRDRSRERDRYYEYPRERSRSRDYRTERPREDGARPYYDERYRERERTGSDREREARSSRTEPERPREREPEREREREVVSHRTRH